MNKVRFESRKALYIGDRRITDFEFEDAYRILDVAIMIKKTLDYYALYFISTKDGKKIKKIDSAKEYKAYNDIVYVRYTNGLCGILSNKGKEIIPAMYDEIKEKNDLLIVRKKKKLGVYNKKGKVIVPIIYDDIFIEASFIKVKSKNLYGCYSFDGKILVPCKYMCITTSRDDVIQVQTLNNLWGLYSSKGKVIIPAEYDNIEAICNNVVVVRKDKLYGLYKLSNGQKILLPKYAYYKYDEFLKHIKLHSKSGNIKVYNTETAKKTQRNL